MHLVIELISRVPFLSIAASSSASSAQVSYNDETRVFTPTQVLGAFFTKCKGIIVGANPGVKEPSVVVSVPAYFTDAQRQAVRDAAAIAGLNCVRTLNDGTAAVLNYGMWKGNKKEFPEGGPETRVLFLDMGHAHFSATLAGFTNDSLRIIASASDDGIGGREFDLAIAKHFAAEFKAKTGLDAWGNRKARVKLMVAAEKAKIAITPYGVNSTPVGIECLFQDRDYSGQFTIEILEGLVAPLMERMGAVIRRALAAGGVSGGAAELASVELIGGGMRPRVVKRAAAVVLGMPLNEETGHGLSSSMNLDEAVARGCALACAQLLPTFRMKPFEVSDVIPHSTRIRWEPPSGTDAASAGASDSNSNSSGSMDVDEEGGASAASTSSTTSTVVFTFGEGTKNTGLVRRVTFRRSEPFTLTAELDPEAEPKEATMGTPIYAGHPRALGRYVVSGFPTGAPEAGVDATTGRVRVDFKHDINGLFSVVRAEFLREIKEEQAPATPPAAAPVDGGVAAPDAAAAPAPAAPKKKYRKVELAVTPDVSGKPAWALAVGLTPSALAEATDAERKMAAADALIHRTQATRNELEAFIYRYREETGEGGPLSGFTDAAGRDSLQGLLNDAESWLYDNFEADLATYEGKLASLRAAVAPLASRKAESEGRYGAVSNLQKAIADFRAVLDNTTGRHGHLLDTDRDTLRSALAEAERWLKESQAKQAGREMYQDPAFTVADVNAWVERLRKECGPIAAKPVPAPAPAPAAPAADAPAPAASESSSPSADAAVPPPAPAAEGGDKMQVD